MTSFCHSTILRSGGSGPITSSTCWDAIYLPTQAISASSSAITGPGRSACITNRCRTSGTFSVPKPAIAGLPPSGPSRTSRSGFGRVHDRGSAEAIDAASREQNRRRSCPDWRYDRDFADLRGLFVPSRVTALRNRIMALAPLTGGPLGALRTILRIRRQPGSIQTAHYRSVPVAFRAEDELALHEVL